MSGAPWWMPVVAGATGASALGAAGKALQWVMGGKGRQATAVKSAVETRQMEALTLEATENANLIHKRADREELLAQKDYAGFFREQLRASIEQEQRIGRMQTQIVSLQTQNDGQLSTISSLTRRLNQVEADLLAAQAERDTLLGELVTERGRSTDLETSLASAHERIAALEAELATLRNGGKTG